MKDIILLFLLTVLIFVFFIAVMTWRAKRHPGQNGCGCGHHHSNEGCRCGEKEPQRVIISEQVPPNAR